MNSQLSTPNSQLGDWPQHQLELRQQEWEMSRALFQLARQLFARMEARPFEKAPIKDLMKVMEVASKLGRRATGLPLETKANQKSLETWQTQQQDAALQRQFEEEIHRVYSMPIEELKAELATSQRSAESNDSQIAPTPPQAIPSYGVPASAGQMPAESNDSQIAPTPPQPVPSPGGEGKGEGELDTMLVPEPANAQSPVPDPLTAYDRRKKHQPYWLNGVYYANPALPEHVARAMVRKSSASG